MARDIWLKRICEDVFRLLPQVDQEDLDYARLHVAPEVMVLEGDVLRPGAHLGRHGKGSGLIFVLVYRGHPED